MNKTTDIRWLAVGALAGLIAAGYGLLRQSSSGADLPEIAVASVNDVVISHDLFERALMRAGAQSASRNNRAQILQRLIDDELLVQRGVELGMTESDTEVRNAIVNSLIASVTAEADAASPSEEDLQQYLADNAERFSYTSNISVQAWETEIEPVAQEFIAGLRAGDAAPALENIRPMPDLPPGMLSADMLANYLGPAITAAAAEMPAGSSAVFARRGRWLVVLVNAKERAYVTELDSIRNRVLINYRRNLADVMLQRYIDNLRDRAEIRVSQQ